MKKVLVLGGTGFVGRHVCEKLQRRGWHITVPTRQLTKANAVLPLPRVTVVEADVHDTRQLLRLMEGQDAVVNLVAILHGNEEAFERVHVELPLAIAEACLADAACRLVHVSALGASADGPSLYQRSKARGEEVLRATGLALTLLRPGVVFGRGDHFLNLFARLQRFSPVMPLAGADTRLQPVWVEDVAEAIAVCLDGGATGRSSIGRTIECAGPEVLSLRELVQLAGRLSGAERPVIGLPLAVGRWQAALLELLPGEPLMSRDNVASLSVPNVASGTLPGLDSLGITPSSVHAIAPTYLGERNARTRLLHLRKQARR
ncbi:MAG: NAD(P)H-binding protein [Hydrogenophaga sp.]|uniref:complex I NDUFA9 subunit family protein n=1 Tax=Hydrogenophaga sp. TaxID=1904254 RepID=UPI00169DB562|nr:complex I NDUFA9 subunit family protein [Hydrogenophaga sp.]NIM40406.1 NAD(P)H-binding protein [Hydrogenophaga sp.]NIN25313.1 NAD(P)H-binding protein [Hydrogenophaga sp.]NIN29880.1 NAD(P)H-binding protein [Hydrogenophaga sp.]NIN54352.1 NAD(P)H-binding protein [Hydrogenophaga sp.]NIO52891.1 NAD(P)H-binding protein [Hydrogenophaga sp.]